jgi:hypothetical protein
LFENLSKKEIDILKQRYQGYESMKDLYSTNEEFKSFVDKTCKDNDISLDLCLLMKTVQDVAEYYRSKSNDISSPIIGR